MDRQGSLKLGETLILRPLFPYKACTVWVFWVAIQVLLTNINGNDSAGMARVICWSVEAMLALAALILATREMTADNKAIFVGFTLFFGFSGFVVPIYIFFLRTRLLVLYEFSEFHVFQYSKALYFLLLLFVVSQIAISLGTALHARVKQFASVTSAVAICFFFFIPYVADPYYLYRQPDIRDYHAVTQAMQEAKVIASDRYPATDISSSLRLLQMEDGKAVRTLTPEEVRLRIQELMPVLQSGYEEALFYRPLYDSCVGAAGACFMILVFFVISSFLRDQPKSAFIEKIAWLILLFVVLEGLHFRVYELTYRRSTFDAIQEIGAYLSALVMLVVFGLFVLRLKFISTVEGRYYEGRVNKDALGITRWRDVVDNWVLRKFVNAPDLNRRFILRGEGKAAEEHDELK